eukprot:TRINITY_DN50190_c0_g1_i1.p1 TRINITY_DN50190_c0_g1~~TRINITY_DN50190_c0_g1_i1.p1  ORF type:complete len:226 (+),score=58.35 TRINITY_DN50190_c0_g1_i1:79-756(+)
MSPASRQSRLWSLLSAVTLWMPWLHCGHAHSEADAAKLMEKVMKTQEKLENTEPPFVRYNVDPKRLCTGCQHVVAQLSAALRTRLGEREGKHRRLTEDEYLEAFYLQCKTREGPLLAALTLAPDGSVVENSTSAQSEKPKELQSKQGIVDFDLLMRQICGEIVDIIGEGFLYEDFARNGREEISVKRICSRELRMCESKRRSESKGRRAAGRERRRGRRQKKAEL